MSQYSEGQATVNGTTVTLVDGGTTTGNVQAGDLWRFQGDPAPGFYTVASVTDETNFELTGPYTGPKDTDTEYDYLVTRDFTPNLALAELSPGDVDIREIFTYNMRLIDSGGIGSGGGEGPGPLDTGTRMVFDQDEAPLGWTRDVSSAMNDRAVHITAGGRAHGGSWTLGGITMGSHVHSLAFTVGYQGQNNPEAASGATAATQTGAASASLASDGSWRPLHRDMIVCEAD